MAGGKAASKSASEALLGEAGLNNGKSALAKRAAQPPKCPECTSQRVWKDGLRYARKGMIQRFLCRSCGYRFSETQVKLNIAGKILKQSNSGQNLPEADILHGNFSFKQSLNNSSFKGSKNIRSHDPSKVTIAEKGFNILRDYNRDYRVCATGTKEAKNLVCKMSTGTRTEPAQRESTQDTKGKIIEYIWFMKKQGYAESTIKTRTKILKQLVKRGAILDDPESIKKIIAEQTTWNEGTKSFAVVAYSSYLNKEGKIWNPPRYRRKEKIPFIPTEKELDQLISSSGKKLSIYLQCCKETGSDPGELLHMEWIDVNKENSTVTINHPVKGHNPRIIPVSQELIGRLETLPKKTEKVFNTKDMYPNLFTQRRRAAKKFNNPRLLKISFVTIRHWKGTMEYHRTKDILHVKQLLGHKQIQNTMVYINLENAVFNNKRKDEFTVRIAHNLEEAIRLAESGFDRFDEIDGQKLYRKRK